MVIYYSSGTSQKASTDYTTQTTVYQVPCFKNPGVNHFESLFAVVWFCFYEWKKKLLKTGEYNEGEHLSIMKPHKKNITSARHFTVVLQHLFKTKELSCVQVAAPEISPYNFRNNPQSTAQWALLNQKHQLRQQLLSNVVILKPN